MVNNLNRLAAKYYKDTSGSVVPAFAVGLMAVLLSVGAAVDYSRISQNKSFVTGAIDAAVLQAAKRMSAGVQDKTQLENEFKQFLLANLEGRGVDPNDVNITKFQINPISGTVDVGAEVLMDTSFMALVGIDTVGIPASAQATYGVGKVEVSFVLDVTGSMGDYLDLGVTLSPEDSGKYQNDRISALKLAARNAVEKLVSDTPGGNTRVAIVPYASTVNAGSFPVLAGGSSAVGGCVVGRTKKQYTAENFSNYPVQQGGTTYCPAVSVLPLSDNKVKVLSTLDSLVAWGGTAGHLGVAWGQYTLSDKVGIWNVNEMPAAPSNDVNKVVVLMTDGKFNTYSAKPVPNQQIASENAAKKSCKNMRDSGITIYSVVLGTDNPDDPLKNCASTNSEGKKLFFKVSTASALFGAFDAIAAEIGDLRLSF